MNSKRELYDTFVNSAPLTEETYKELLRLSGYAPTENVGEIPRSFEEFQEMLPKFQKEYSSEELYNRLKSYNNNNDLIKKDDLFKLLITGDKLTEDEFNEFEKLIVVDDNNMISLKAVVDILLSE